MKDKSVYEPPKVSKLDYSESLLGEEPDCNPVGSNASAGCKDGNNATGFFGCNEGNDAESTFPEFSDIPGTDD